MSTGLVSCRALRQAQGSKPTVKRGRTASHQLRAAGSHGGDHGRAITGPVKTRTQIPQYRCRWDNPLIAAELEEYEPEDRSSGKLAGGGLP
jgi:hypothetical protein